jgi:hypothetical protein
MLHPLLERQNGKYFDGVDAAGLTETSQGSRSGRRPLRRQNWEMFESSHRGRKKQEETPSHEQNPCNERYCETPLGFSGRTLLTKSTTEPWLLGNKYFNNHVSATTDLGQVHINGKDFFKDKNYS